MSQVNGTTKLPGGKEFLAWLRTKRATEFVGERCMITACPYFNFLRSTDEWSGVVNVTAITVCFGMERDNMLTPPDISQFIQALDEQKGVKVTARKCIKTLLAVRPDLGE